MHTILEPSLKRLNRTDAVATGTPCPQQHRATTKVPVLISDCLHLHVTARANLAQLFCLLLCYSPRLSQHLNFQVTIFKFACLSLRFILKLLQPLCVNNILKKTRPTYYKSRAAIDVTHCLKWIWCITFVRTKTFHKRVHQMLLIFPEALSAGVLQRSSGMIGCVETCFVCRDYVCVNVKDKTWTTKASNTSNSHESKKILVQLRNHLFHGRAQPVDSHHYVIIYILCARMMKKNTKPVWTSHKIKAEDFWSCTPSVVADVCKRDEDTCANGMRIKHYAHIWWGTHTHAHSWWGTCLPEHIELWVRLRSYTHGPNLVRMLGLHM